MFVCLYYVFCTDSMRCLCVALNLTIKIILNSFSVLDSAAPRTILLRLCFFLFLSPASLRWNVQLRILDGTAIIELFETRKADMLCLKELCNKNRLSFIRSSLRSAGWELDMLCGNPTGLKLSSCLLTGIFTQSRRGLLE